MHKGLATRWSVTSFSFTPELLARKFSPAELIRHIAYQGIAANLEIDGPQFFRNYPTATADVAMVAEVSKEVGIHIPMIGGYMDRFSGEMHPVDQEVVMQRLHRQLEVASQLGARRLRLQFDALRESEIDQAIEWAEKFDVRILLELQGSATLDQPHIKRVIDWVIGRNHPMLRILLDSSLLMRGFPSTYKQHLSSLGLSPDLVTTLEQQWLSKAAGDYREWLVSELDQGHLPKSLMSQMPTLTSRFGHSKAKDWQMLSNVLDSLHLKYWDSDDSHGALSGVAEEALSLFDTAHFPGYIVSEWGGHDWLPLEVASGSEMSVQHKVAVASVLTNSQENQPPT